MDVLPHHEDNKSFVKQFFGDLTRLIKLLADNDINPYSFIGSVRCVSSGIFYDEDVDRAVMTARENAEAAAEALDPLLRANIWDTDKRHN